jgi:23S rRNA A1618 N6-methylase RlmF
MNKQWKMIVSDIDDESIDFANKNVSNNNLQSRISSKSLNLSNKLLIGNINNSIKSKQGFK